MYSAAHVCFTSGRFLCLSGGVRWRVEQGEIGKVEGPSGWKWMEMNLVDMLRESSFFDLLTFFLKKKKKFRA